MGLAVPLSHRGDGVAVDSLDALDATVARRRKDEGRTPRRDQPASSSTMLQSLVRSQPQSNDAGTTKYLPWTLWKVTASLVEPRKASHTFWPLLNSNSASHNHW